MQLNKLQVAMGASRAEHAANIMMAPDMRRQYATLHHNGLLAAGREPYVAVNDEGGIVARNSDAGVLVGNANTVRHEDFLTIQERIIAVRRRSLHMNQDLMDAGLTFTVGIGDQLVGYENINEFQEAEQEMNPNSFQGNDTVFNEAYAPNPITHQSFSVPWRQNGFDYKRSLGMTESVRQVAERLENTLCNGNTGIVVSFNSTNHVLYGYTTHPDRGTGTISDWTNVANRDKIVDELIDEIGSMWADQGGVANDSVIVYVANDIWNVLQKDYNSGFPSKTMLARMKDIAQVKDVKPAEKLATKQVVLVEMEARTVELAVASDIIAVPHIKTNPMAPQVLTTYAAMVPLIKVDSNSNTGVRHLTV